MSGKPCARHLALEIKPNHGRPLTQAAAWIKTMKSSEVYRFRPIEAHPESITTEHG